MGFTTIIESFSEDFDSGTGEIHRQHNARIRKSRIEPTDEFIKVSKYLNVIFAYNNIPLHLVPISLILAQRMQFRTNIIYLLKDDKEEISSMLSVSLDRVNKLIQECKKYNIIKPLSRGKFEVNSFLFSTGTTIETRKLQAHFDFQNGAYSGIAEQKNLINGEVVRKAVLNKTTAQIPGQIELEIE